MVSETTARAELEPLDVAELLAAARQMRAARDAAEIDEALAASRGPLRQLRVGRQVLPLGLIAVVWAAGTACWLAPPLWPVLAAAALATAVGGWLIRGRRHGVHLAATLAAGQSWLWWAAHTGPAGARAAALWIGGYALAAPYWLRHRIPAPTDLPPPPPPAAPEVVEPEPTVVRLWDRRVACVGGALPGSYLTDHQTAGATESWTIQLDPGRQTTTTAIAVTAMVASALGRPLADVGIDRHPSGDLSRAVLLVTGVGSRNPLAVTVLHPGADRVYDPRTGLAQIGIHPDGAPARWAYVVPGWGLAGGALIGGTGSGKSTGMTGLAATGANTGILSVWAGDPQGGQSMPAVIRHATWGATTLDEILRQLRAAAAAIDIRGALNGLRDVDLHVPTPAEPGILLFLDEIHKIFKDAPPKIREEAIALASLIAREGRKAAVALVVADQYPGLETFGNSEAMRSSLFARNVAVLRTASNIAKGLVPGLDVNPKELPTKFDDGSPTSGLGYLVGERAVPFRFFHTPNAGQMLAAAPAVELDATVANYIGADYTDRHNRRLAARAGQAARIATLNPAALERILATDPALADALAALQRGRTVHDLSHPTPRPSVHTPRRPGVPFARSAAIDCPPWPTFGGGQAPADAPAPVGAREKIHDLIRTGRATRTGDLIRHTGYGETHVRNTLRALAADGAISRTGHGRWKADP